MKDAAQHPADDEIEFMPIGASAYLALAGSHLRGVLYWEPDDDDHWQTGEPGKTFRWMWVSVEAPQFHYGLTVKPLQERMTSEERQANVAAAMNDTRRFLSDSASGPDRNLILAQVSKRQTKQ